MLDLLNTRQREIRVVMRVCAALVTIVFLFGLPDSLVQSSIRLATPFVLGSLGALLASRAGVLNLAIEGKMLLGAFVGVAILFQSGHDPLVGVVAATVSGGILGLVFAILYLRIRINLIILALAVNLLVANGTVFFMRASFGVYGTLADPSIRSLPTLQIPLIEDLPVLGPLLSGYNAIVYVGWIMVVVVWVMLFRTRFGRHIRAVGENQEAAESVGINVTRVQIFALTLSGMLAGLAGAFLSLGVLSQFLENMTAARGWIALTVSLFALQRPVAAFFTSLFFGFAEALSFFIQAQPHLNIPADLVLALPQLATIAALVMVALRIRASELIKRRDFAARFGQEISDLKDIVRPGKAEAT